MDDEELEEIKEICSAATPGPWFVRALDDDQAMGLVAVSTVPDTGLGERWPTFDHRQIIAATLVQHPRYVDSADQCWEENAAFIAMARDAVPRLLEEVRHLREQSAGEPYAAAREDNGQHHDVALAEILLSKRVGLEHIRLVGAVISARAELSLLLQGTAGLSFDRRAELVEDVLAWEDAYRDAWNKVASEGYAQNRSEYLVELEVALRWAVDGLVSARARLAEK
ncbi:hypothetical protein ACQPZJ_06690 [Actinoplanes sp. CA-054009]